MPSNRFPPPWSIEELEACFVVKDSARQKLAFVYYEEEPGRRLAAKLLTKEEARQIALDIARLPDRPPAPADLPPYVESVDSSDIIRTQRKHSAAVLSPFGENTPPNPMMRPEGPITLRPEGTHTELLGRIAELEQTIAELKREPAPGIGHNKPPEPLEPLTIDFESIENVIATWRAYPVRPAQPPGGQLETALQFKTLSQRIKDYAVKQTDLYVTEAVKEAGRQTGKWIVRAPLLVLFADRLLAAADAVIAWLRSLSVG
jgi:hypothetical protein